MWRFPILLSLLPKCLSSPHPTEQREPPQQSDLVLQPLFLSTPLQFLSLPLVPMPPLFSWYSLLPLPPRGAGLCKPQLLDWRMNGWSRGDWPLFHPWESTSAGLRTVAARADVILTGGAGVGRGGGGEWRGNWLSRTICRGERGL